jgi:Zn-finger nucleic acid-binding protein
MQAMRVEQTEVDRCTACEGLWFDALEERDVHAKESIDLLDPPGAAPRPANTDGLVRVVSRVLR